MGKSLFQKSALDSISTPEQLDQQTKIVKPYYWLGIFGFVVLLVSVGIWAVKGNINSTITMEGTIFPKAGVRELVTTCEGTVQDVLFKTGEQVSKGDIIAIIPDESTLEEIKDVREKIGETEDKGKKEKLQLELEKLYVTYQQNSVIRATETGMLQSIVSTGKVVNRGSQIATIMVNSQYSNNRQVVAYVPLKVAKRLKVGTEAQVCPSFVSREEYGYMKGCISSIGTIPVTEESIEQYYGNVQYAYDVLPEESCVEILISIEIDDTSENLFEWSNEKGKSLNVDVGTVCNIQAVTEQKKPICLLF